MSRAGRSLPGRWTDRSYLRNSSLSLGETSSGSGKCVGALAGQDLGLGDDVWLLGDSFMKNVYTAFSFDQDAVGFAELVPEEDLEGPKDRPEMPQSGGASKFAKWFQDAWDNKSF